MEVHCALLIAMLLLYYLALIPPISLLTLADGSVFESRGRHQSEVSAESKGSALLSELLSVGVLMQSADGSYLCTDSYLRKRKDGAVVVQKNVPQLDWTRIQNGIENMGIRWSEKRKKQYQDVLKGVPRSQQENDHSSLTSLESKVVEFDPLLHVYFSGRLGQNIVR